MQVSKSLRESVVSAEGLWEGLCIKQGWRQERVNATSMQRASAMCAACCLLHALILSYPIYPLTANACHHDSDAVSGARSALPADEADERWSAYYARRMTARWRVRRYMKRYIPFLFRPSQMALMPGSYLLCLCVSESER